MAGALRAERNFQARGLGKCKYETHALLGMQSVSARRDLGI